MPAFRPSRSLLFSFAPWAKSPHSASPPATPPLPAGLLRSPRPGGGGGPACLRLGALLFQLQPHTSQKGAASTPHPQHLWSLLITNSSCSGPLRRDEAGTLQAFQIKAPSVRRIPGQAVPNEVNRAVRVSPAPVGCRVCSAIFTPLLEGLETRPPVSNSLGDSSRTLRCLSLPSCEQRGLTKGSAKSHCVFPLRDSDSTLPGNLDFTEHRALLKG